MESFLSFSIPHDKISEVINAADIIEIISNTVQLKKKGKEYLGLCPFHSEKTPSFTVNPGKQVFYCHGCHEGGNVFNFVMKQNNISFPEAVNMLAKQYSIEIVSKKMTPEQKKELTEREKLISINKAAMIFFKESLNSYKGKKALKYLHNRKITKETISNFNLGYAPSGWNNLVQYFSSKKIPLPLAEKTGLIVPNKNGFYDRFRDRVIFPISGLNNQISGFGGRVMDDSLPKYLNSPETSLYNKSRSVYGADKAKEQCRVSGIVYIVEGYFDLIALHQHDIYNSAATLGTALTREHVRLLKGFIGKNGTIILVYDSDNAGVKAAQRSIDIFNKEYADAKISILPSGYDPDSYLFEFGKESFLKTTKKSLTAISFLIESVIKKYGLSIEGKVKIISKVAELLGAIDDNVLRSLYIKDFSERIEIDESALLQKIRTVISNNNTRKKTVFPKKSIITPNGHQIKSFSESKEGDHQGKNIKIERHIISMMINFPEILPEIKQYNVLKYFNSSMLKNLGQRIIKHSDTHGKEIFEIISEIQDNNLQKVLASITIIDKEQDIKSFNKLITRFVESEKDRKKTSLFKTIKIAEESNDEKLLLESLNKANIRLKLLKDKQKKNNKQLWNNL